MSITLPAVDGNRNETSMGCDNKNDLPRGTESDLEKARRAIQANDAARAIEILEAAVQRDPQNPQLLETLAQAYEGGGRIMDALRQLDRIIDIDAATATTWQRTGQLLTNVREYAQALGAFEHSIELDDRNAEVRHDYGRVLYRLGNVASAAKQLEKASELCDDVAPRLALATLAPSNPDYNHADVLRIRQTLAKEFARCAGKPPDAPRRTRSGRLRIGYLSSWFDRENYMKPVWGLINHHDRRQFEIHLFSDTSVGQGIPGYHPCVGDHTHQTQQLQLAELAETIQNAGIDILVDLNAYSTPQRLGLFLSRPAPVTVAWFNMYATSGFPGFDYIIGDHVTVRPGEERHYCEKVLRIPQSYLSFTVTHDAPSVVDPPCCQHGYVTFGSLVTQYKITAPVLDAWSTILHAVPTAKMLLGNADLDSPSNRDYVAESFQRRGIDAARIEFRGRADHRTFLEYYNAIDIALDAFPYNGGTTTMEAIWQGVPVITFDGDRWAARTSASILAGTHLMKFVASDVDGYAQTAIAQASASNVGQRLRSMRQTMRESLVDCPACDTQSLARAMEALYLEIAVSDV